MWDEIVPDSGEPWIQKRAELAANGFPIVDFAAMERVLASGADTSDVAALMRSAQVLALYNFANLLDGEGWQTFESLVGDAKLGWRVVVSADADVIREVGLHETVEELDPTGRHGAPRG